jgi:1,4-alpha-glucan branching enzyme
MEQRQEYQPQGICNMEQIKHSFSRSFCDVDPYLEPFRGQIEALWHHARHIEAILTNQGNVPLDAFAAAHEYYGLHKTTKGWVIREWAPMATAIFLIGDCNGWQQNDNFALKRVGDMGDWELKLPPEALQHGQHFKFVVHWHGGSGDRIPAYARRVVQDPHTLLFSAQVWTPEAPYQWKNTTPPKPAFHSIYECHVGMAQEDARVGTYEEFRTRTLPRIKAAGYNTIQIMAIQEHPYYGSFGYHVSSFFAPSSRFGTPEELKALIDDAHGLGLYVIIDLVHSHAVSNEAEGLSRFDGTTFQYFHDGPLGQHPAWGSRCFDYSKPQVLHFLLSNCRYWIDAFHVDGFRFDGITSMLYKHRGLGTAFMAYHDYFNGDLDLDAVAYLTLANKLIHAIKPGAITVAEDVSGLPGLAAPVPQGGCGFDYRLGMGLPDAWFELIRKRKDEDWHMAHLFHFLTDRRKEEKTISYVESHDQAIVGDKTLAFELMDAEMYERMTKVTESLVVDRGVALHKMIRLVTAATANGGYLNFMGNEFGHPEWIDFPREGNGWSYHYARRQWSLRDNPDLRYHGLAEFDAAMMECLHTPPPVHEQAPRLLTAHDSDKVLAFTRGDYIFIFNFNPNQSFTDYGIPAAAGTWELILDSDTSAFGGFNRLEAGLKFATTPVAITPETTTTMIHLYLPTRTALVFRKTADKRK